MYQIVISKKAKKFIDKLSKNEKSRVVSAIERLPNGEDIKKLKGVENGYRLRVGDLRVLFSIEDNDIYIDNIIPRGQAYNRI